MANGITTYFRKFPQVEYKFADNEDTVLWQDLSVYIDAIDQTKEYGAFYASYQIQNNERPDHVSFRLYGTTDYYWTFWLMNDHLREQGWPISNSQLYLRAQQYYPNLTLRLQGTATEYENPPFGDLPNITTRPFCRDPNFKVGAYVWLQNEKKAGTIERIDQNLGQIHIKLGGGNPKVADAPNLAAGQTGIKDSRVRVIDEFSALRIQNVNSGYVPVDFSEQNYSEAIITQAYNQYDAPHHYEDVNGNWVWPSYDPGDPNPLPEEPNIHPFDWSSVTTQQSVSYFDRLREVNDNQRAIKVLKPDVISQVVNEFAALLTNRRARQ